MMQVLLNKRYDGIFNFGGLVIISINISTRYKRWEYEYRRSAKGGYMYRVKIGLFILGVVFLISGCAIIDAQDCCSARGGSWTEYDVIGQKIWPGRCVNAEYSLEEFRRAYPNSHYCRKKRSSSKTTPLRLIINAGRAHFPKKTHAPTAGETYLLTQLTPFLSEIIKSDDIIKTLASMGQCKIDQKGSEHWDSKYNYFTKSYTGNHCFTVGDPPMKWLYVTQRNGKRWPFSKEELIDWLSSLGLDVFDYGGTYIYGVAGHIGGESIDSKNINNYPFYLWITLSYQREYGYYNYDAPTIVGYDLALRWTNQSKAWTVFCEGKER